jgi:hypothetical protein
MLLRARLLARSLQCTHYFVYARNMKHRYPLLCVDCIDLYVRKIIRSIYLLLISC